MNGLSHAGCFASRIENGKSYLGLFPRPQVDERQAAARYTPVLAVFDEKRSGLELLYIIRVVADYSSQRYLPNLGQLFLGETSDQLTALVPKPVANPEPFEALEENVRESRAKTADRAGIFHDFIHGAHVQIHLVGIFVEAVQFPEGIPRNVVET